MIANANPAHRGDGGGVPKTDHTAGGIDFENRVHTLERQPRLDVMLHLFTVRAVEVFGNVIDGRITLVDGADLLFDAATASGLAERIGHDSLQKLLAAAFATAAKEGDQRR